MMWRSSKGGVAEDQIIWLREQCGEVVHVIDNNDCRRSLVC